MNSHAIIAARGGPATKSRCAEILTLDQRDKLTAAMVEDMIVALGTARRVTRIHLVTPTPTLAALAERLGAEPQLEAEPVGLNAAFEAARYQIAKQTPGDRLLMLPGDLPLINPDEIDDAIERHALSSLGIVPAADGGTGALLLIANAPIIPCFGPDSAAAHCAKALAAKIEALTITLPSLAQDIDRPADIERLRASDSTSQTARFLRALTISGDQTT